MEFFNVFWINIMVIIFGIIRLIPQLVVLCRGKWVEQTMKKHEELIKEGQDEQQEEEIEEEEQNEEQEQEDEIIQEEQQLEEISEIDEENEKEESFEMNKFKIIHRREKEDEYE
ncbi:MAG: hypothetical protein EZS28_041010 [Streblomastix strix]|uniref:Uncharacterized protein n=1 Tax=Streblomastix strix TaxID=222440 RepID=A0A5J4TZP5_9EUKA|nr:MAG: hypothetical protein EZS28_041010 [Streblomastix strix]